AGRRLVGRRRNDDRVLGLAGAKAIERIGRFERRSRPASRGDRLVRLDERPVEPWRRLRPEPDGFARWPRRRRAAAGRPVGQRPELRAVRGLVARRDRPARPRLHRMARSDADRSDVPRRARRHPPPGGTAQERVGRQAGAARAVPAALRAPARAGGRRPAARRGAQTAVEAPERRTTQPALEPWTIRVKRTIPNVTPWITSRCARPAGSDRARATDTAPRRP